MGMKDKAGLGDKVKISVHRAGDPPPEERPMHELDSAEDRIDALLKAAVRVASKLLEVDPSMIRVSLSVGAGDTPGLNLVHHVVGEAVNEDQND